MKIQIPAPAQEILEKLNEHGYEAYIVGGCVRDMLLGREPGDWDITTSALPGQVKQVFGRTVDTGIQHGTVTVLMGKEGYEVTTYRIDGEYGDGRHPDSVSFTPSLIEDLKRRDFTINAMAYNQNQGIVDVFGGREDLKQGIIRCVGNPMDRFREDALRILRALRFSAQLDFDIEEETLKAVSVIAPNLVHVSKERIQVELTKLLLSGCPERMELVYKTGISPYVSEAFHQAGANGVPWLPISVPAVKHMRWAAFLRKASPAQAVKVLRDLKLDNDTIYRVKMLTDWVKRPAGGADKAAIRRTMSQMEPVLFDDLLVLKKCLAEEDACRGDIPETGPELLELEKLSGEIRADGDCISLKTLAVTGNDIIKAGVKPGKKVGETLAMLLGLVLEKPERNNRQWLLEQAEAACKKD